MIFAIPIYLIVIYLLRRNPKYSLLIALFSTSLSPVIEKYFGETTYAILLLVILTTLLTIVINKRIRINIYYLFTIVVFFFFQILLLFSTEIFFISLQLSILRYVIWPLAAYITVRNIKSESELIPILMPYIAFQIAINYYRSFFDYSFLNIFDYYPGFSFIELRPGSLNSPIIFSIELVIFLVFVLSFGNSLRQKIFTVAISLFPLYVMQSRSSYLILLTFVVYFLFYKKKFILLLVMLLSFFVLFLYQGLDNRIFYFLTIFDSSEFSYQIRFDSIKYAIQFYTELPLINIFFGLGTGVARASYQNGIYVENFFIGYVIESGILMSILLFSCILYIISLGFKKKQVRNLTILLVLIFLTNMLASNLTANVIQLFVWTIIFIILRKAKGVKKICI